MRPAAERETEFLALEVDRVRIRVLGRVPARGANHDHDVRPCRDGPARHVDILGGDPRHEHHGPVVAHQFLDRGRYHGRVGDKLPPQRGVSGERREGGAQRGGHGFQAGEHEQERQAEQLVVAEPFRAGVGEELAEQVAGAAVLPPLRNVADEVAVEFRAHPHGPLPRRLPARHGEVVDQRVLPGVQPVPVLERQAEQGEEHLRGQRHRQLRDQVALAAAGETVDQLARQSAHHRQPGRDAARAEERLQDPPVAGVLGRVEGDRHHGQRAAGHVERPLGREQPGMLERELRRLARDEHVPPARAADDRTGVAQHRVGGGPALGHGEVREKQAPARRWLGHLPTVAADALGDT